MRALSFGVARIITLVFLLLIPCGHATAKDGAAAASVDAGQPAQVRQLLDLLADPVVQKWLHEAKEAQAPATVAAPRRSASAGITARIGMARAHVAAVIATLPLLPDHLAEAGDRLMRAIQNNDKGRHAGALVLWAFALGTAGAFAARRWGRRTTREWLSNQPDPAVKLARLGLRLLIASLPAIAFATGVLITLLLFEWPPELKNIVVAYSFAITVILLVHHGLRVLLAAPAPVRSHDSGKPDGVDAETAFPAPVPTTDTPSPSAGSLTAAEAEKATFWRHRIVLFIGYFAIAAATVEMLEVLDTPQLAVQACAYLLGLGQLAIGLEAVWRRGRGKAAARNPVGTRTLNVLLTVLGVVLWWLWAAGFNGLFWLLTFALVLPGTIRGVDWRVKRLLSPANGIQPAYASVLEICLTRGARLALVFGAVYILAEVWQIDLIALADQTTPQKRLARGVLHAVVTLFLADFLWQLIRALIDARLAQAGRSPAPSESQLAEGDNLGTSHAHDPARGARLRTLLPIFRNILLVVIATIAILMALSGLGVEIAPLIAGAGVVGVAVGFGSQTLVRDVISGVFYLLDDAFRVGEYIQSGSYKGTVESFSLRSVKLRHHRGPVYTVPFGQLGAVQNMSRDWVMDKFTINVAYDTDLEKARKIIKTIGQELAEDTAHAANIMEPLKMQGVEQFGEYGIQIKCKMKTRPGEQFMIRRLALRQIKQAFDEAGIRFALPQVHVAGGGETAAAASQIRENIARAREQEA